MKILIINGPNLNMLGMREKNIYGNLSLEKINQSIETTAKQYNMQIDFFQSNSESAIIETIHQAFKQIDYIIINAAAFTHYSIAIRDALLAVSIPFIEVHLSNVFARESFRAHSVLSDIAIGSICGFGSDSYLLALEAIKKIIDREEKTNERTKN